MQVKYAHGRDLQVAQDRHRQKPAAVEVGEEAEKAEELRRSLEVGEGELDRMVVEGDWVVADDVVVGVVEVEVAGKTHHQRSIRDCHRLGSEEVAVVFAQGVEVATPVELRVVAVVAEQEQEELPVVSPSEFAKHLLKLAQEQVRQEQVA